MIKDTCKECGAIDPDMESDGCLSETDGRQDTPTWYVTTCCAADMVETNICDDDGCVDAATRETPNMDYCEAHYIEYLDAEITNASPDAFTELIIAQFSFIDKMKGIA